MLQMIFGVVMLLIAGAAICIGRQPNPDIEVGRLVATATFAGGGLWLVVDNVATVNAIIVSWLLIG